MSKIKLLLIICSAIIFKSCEDTIVNPAESNLNVEDFEAAWNRVNTVYPLSLIHI